jgi:hypothetical protein
VKSNGSIYVAAVFVLLAGYFSYQWWFNQNRVVKRRLGELAATLSVPAAEPDLERVARLGRMRQYLSDEIRITRGRSGPELTSRDAIVATAAIWKPEGGGSVDFVDVDVKLEGESARAYVTAEVTTHGPGSNERTLDSREAVLSLVKRDAWVVSEVELKDRVTGEEPAPPPSHP